MMRTRSTFFCHVKGAYLRADRSDPTSPLYGARVGSGTAVDTGDVDVEAGDAKVGDEDEDGDEPNDRNPRLVRVSESASAMSGGRGKREHRESAAASGSEGERNMAKSWE